MGKQKGRSKQSEQKSKYGARTKKGMTRAKGMSHAASFGARRAAPSSPRARREEGLFSGTRSGYGFVCIEGMDEDIFIPASQTRGALDGDRVAVSYRVMQDREGHVRTEGTVVKILEMGRSTIQGTLCVEENRSRRGRRDMRYFLLPDDSHLGIEPTVTDRMGAHVGDKVELLLSGRNPYEDPSGTVLRVFGAADSLEANYLAILASAGVETEFSPDALAEAEEMAARPLSEEGRTRYDEAIFTIDGADAKDLDDAISLVIMPNGNYRLGVHIADVSEYVRPHTALDRTAMSRGTSIYFVDQVVPMLPTALSNGACSLNAGEDKYALSAVITLSPTGQIVSSKVERSIIRSKVRGVYSEVNDLFDKGERSAYYEKYKEVYPTLCTMRVLYDILYKKGRARGAVELDREEAKILLDDKGFPAEIVPRARGIAERMIEQFMLAANESVAVLMHGKEYPCVYRVHEDPTPERVRDFVTYAHHLGLDTRKIAEEEPDGRAFASLLDEAKEKGLSSAVSYTLLRTMAKAKYSEVPHKHFGLGIELYAHFTSPIRRLSDLATHRMVKAVLLDRQAKEKYEGYARRAALAATEGELRALGAERRIDALYKTLYMSRRIGEEYDAVISSVNSFGLFAELENTCEGLIPSAAIGEGYVFDEKKMIFVRGNTVYRLGDRIRVRVAEADIARGRIRFDLVREDTEGSEEISYRSEWQTSPYTPKGGRDFDDRTGNHAFSHTRPHAGKHIADRPHASRGKGKQKGKKGNGKGKGKRR